MAVAARCGAITVGPRLGAVLAVCPTTSMFFPASAADGGSTAAISIQYFSFAGITGIQPLGDGTLSPAQIYLGTCCQSRVAWRKPELIRRRFSASAQARPAYSGHLTGVETRVQNKAKNTPRASKMSSAPIFECGVTGAAMVGAGALLIAAPGAPAPTTARVKLASTGFTLPRAPIDDCLQNPATCGGLGGPDRGCRPRPGAGRCYMIPGVDTNAIFFGAIGSGGWLIGDGLSGTVDPTLRNSAMVETAGFWGLGGDGMTPAATAATPGSSTRGSGGDGGAGLDAVYGDDPGLRSCDREAQRGDPGRRRR